MNIFTPVKRKQNKTLMSKACSLLLMGVFDLAYNKDFVRLQAFVQLPGSTERALLHSASALAAAAASSLCGSNTGCIVDADSVFAVGTNAIHVTIVGVYGGSGYCWDGCYLGAYPTSG